MNWYSLAVATRQILHKLQRSLDQDPNDASPPARRALDLIVLEDRILMSASPAAAAGEAAAEAEAIADATEGLESWTTAVDALFDLGMPGQLDDYRGLFHSDEAFTGGDEPPAAADVSTDMPVAQPLDSLQMEGSESSDSLLVATTDDESASQADPAAREIVFVDVSAENFQQLVDDLLAQRENGRSVDVILLDDQQDGLEQISAALHNRHDLDAIHLVTHGTDRAVKLGATWVDLNRLESDAAAVAEWQLAMAPDADLLFYGCDLAGGEAGRTLLEGFHVLTGADVAASDDATGAAALNGDWDLEFQLGQIEHTIVFSNQLQQQWEGILSTFTVTNTNDSGAGSMRQAIIDANALAGQDTIDFNIGIGGGGAGGPQTIDLSTALPSITDAVILDGTTQSGYAGTPMITLNGGGLTGNGLTITAGGSTVRGFVIQNFSGIGIQLTTAGGNTIEGNYIGTNSAGTAAAANTSFGIEITTANNVIGGTTAATRNVISGNDNHGIRITGSSADDNQVIGNYIGLNAAGTAAVANTGNGILIDAGADDNLIGGSLAGQANVISGNTADGISISDSGTSNNLVQGNYIGTDAAGTSAIGNGNDGISIQGGAANNTIGGIAAGQGNVIAHNSGDGVDVQGSSSGIIIRGNSIYSNAQLGIDLNSDGVTVNDPNDVDSGPNGLLNMPILTSLVNTASGLEIQGNLDTVNSTTFDVDFYATGPADASGYGEATSYLGSTTVTTNASGTFSFTVTLSSYLTVGAEITATATNATIGTSEFSQNRQVANTLPVANDDTYSVNEDGTLDTSTDWFDNNWGARRKLTFDNTAQAQNLQDFPVLVKLDSSRIDYTKVQNGGQDLRFVDSDGTLLAHEIELWNASGDSYVWVKIPQVDGGSNADYIWLYHDNATAPDGQNAAAVWSSNFQAVYHLNEDPAVTAGVFNDSGSNGFDATNIGSVDAIGILAGGEDFDGVDDYIDLGANRPFLNNVNVATVSAWIHTDTLSGGGDILGVTRGDDTSSSRASIAREGDDIRVYARSTDDSSENASVVTTTNVLSTGQWHYVVAVIDYAGDAVTVYVDGVAQATSGTPNFTNTATPNTNSMNAAIGSNEGGSGAFFDGRIDEVRIEDTGRSADWINAQYLAMTDQFLVFGSEENAAGVLDNDVDYDLDTLTVTLEVGPSQAAFFNLNADGSFVYTPLANYEGPDSFTYRASDGTGNSNIATVNINVNGSNDPPVLDLDNNDSSGRTGADFETTFVENGGAVNISDLADAVISDVDNGTLQSMTITLTNQPDGIAESLSADTTGTSIIASYDSSTGVLSLTGADSVASYQQVLQTIQYNNTSQNPNPTQRVVTYVANDGTANSNTATAYINISPQNDPPVLDLDNNDSSGRTGADFETTLVEDGGAVNIADQADAVISDVDNGTLQSMTVTLTNIADGSSESLAANTSGTGISAAYNSTTGVLSLSGVDTVANYQQVLRTLTYDNLSQDPTAGTRQITVQVSDGIGQSPAATAHVNVVPVNDAPVATNDSYTTTNVATLTSSVPGVLSNDSDVDGGPLSAILDAGPAHGSVVLNADGSFVYTPNPGYQGTDSFQYHVHDGSLNSNTATVQLTITAAIVPPPTPNPGPLPSDPVGSNQEDTSSRDDSSSTIEPPRAEEERENVTAESAPAVAAATRHSAGAGTASSQAAGAVDLTRDLAQIETLGISTSADRYGTLTDSVSATGSSARRAAMAAMQLPTLTTSQMVAMVVEPGWLWTQMDKMNQQIDNSIDLSRFSAGAATAVTSLITVGYVFWTVRGGYLMASLLSSLPAWRLMDPLPVLAAWTEGDAEHGESLQSMVDGEPVESPEVTVQ